MAIQLLGVDNVTIGAIDALWKAQRVSIRPVDLTSGGWYSLAMASGALTTAAAGGSILSFRYGGTNLCMVRRVVLNWVVTTAFTAAQLVDHQLIIQRAWTVSDSGGTAAIITGNNQKHRTSLATINSSMDIRMATTGALTAGTRTADSQAMAGTAVWATGLGSGLSSYNLFSHDTGDHPLILAQNEGFTINNVTLMGAAGVIKAYATVEWAEILTTAF